MFQLAALQHETGSRDTLRRDLVLCELEGVVLPLEAQLADRCAAFAREVPRDLPNVYAPQDTAESAR